eukprot:gnl/Spiro4/14094_TR7568_c0_g1_i1.p2 gnl/Spiro4/14094_TR7568_c0_g1~~gnl/Spiro4/14094_TR7568_c0_g1_i1.p2  ORF type:complete len:211 (-),score=65.11 gnl/Spiro4/14094_TR7568_c0_g1_i1:158-790(-)
MGRVIVADTGNDRVQIFSSARDDGLFVRAFGSRGTADGQFTVVWRVCVDVDDNIIVADLENHRIQLFSRDGVYLRKFGTHGSAAGQLYDPTGVCVDRRNHILVADYHNNRIQVFRTDGTFVRKFGSRRQFQSPIDVCVDGADHIFVTATDHRIHQFRNDGTATMTFVREFGPRSAPGPALLCLVPASVCVGPDGELFIADVCSDRILEFR